MRKATGPKGPSDPPPEFNGCSVECPRDEKAPILPDATVNRWLKRGRLALQRGPCRRTRSGWRACPPIASAPCPISWAIGYRHLLSIASGWVLGLTRPAYHQVTRMAAATRPNDPDVRDGRGLDFPFSIRIPGNQGCDAMIPICMTLMTLLGAHSPTSELWNRFVATITGRRMTFLLAGLSVRLPSQIRECAARSGDIALAQASDGERSTGSETPFGFQRSAQPYLTREVGYGAF
jgi:hypothetical protein